MLAGLRRTVAGLLYRDNSLGVITVRPTEFNGNANLKEIWSQPPKRLGELPGRLGNWFLLAKHLIVQLIVHQLILEYCCRALPIASVCKSHNGLNKR